MEQSKQTNLIIGVGVGLLALVLLATIANRVRNERYHATVVATLRDHLGMAVTVEEATPLGNDSHSLSNITVALREGDDPVFSCRHAEWLKKEEGSETGDRYILTVKDGWILVSETGWTRTEYDKMLESGLGHDFAALGLDEVRFENMDVRLRQSMTSFTAQSATGTLLFDESQLGRVTMQTARLNGVKVDKPVHISGTFTTGQILTLQEVGLSVPRMPLFALGIPGLESSSRPSGSFAGDVHFRQEEDGNVYNISGSVMGADLYEVTRLIPGGPYHGLVDLEVQEAQVRGRQLERLVGRGHISDVRIGEFLPGSDQYVEGRLDLTIGEMQWEDGRIDKLTASGICNDVSLAAVSSLVATGRVTGNLTLNIASLSVANDKLTQAEVLVESTSTEREPGTIDRALIGKLAELWTGYNLTRMLPSEVSYTRLGARLHLEEDQLRVFGTHGEEGRTILTVQALGRPWGIIKQPEQVYEIPDLIALARENAAKVDPSRAAAWWKLRHFSEEYWNARMKRYPTEATAHGDFRFNDQLEDVSAAATAKWKATLEDLLADAQTLSRDSLNPTDALTAVLLERTIADELLRLRWRLSRIPLDPLYGPHIQYPLLIVAHPFRNRTDFESYAARLAAIETQLNDHIQNMRNGLKDNFVSPRLIIEKVVPQIQTHLVDDVTRSEFYKPILNANALSESDLAAMDSAVRNAIQRSVLPAFEKLLAFVTDEYLPACRDSIGISNVPNGGDLYAALCRLHTSVDLAPSRIHQIGLDEVERIRSQMANVQADIGFDGSLDSFLRHMRDDPKYRFTSGKELFDTADAILQEAKPKMAQLFTRFPKSDCVMKEMEAFRAKSAPAAFYNPASEDGSRPGYYYINTYAPEQRPRFTLEALTYHESVPGHHFQIALDQENTQLPRFRRHGSFTAYVEGWALYTEKLGYEIGGYDDHLSRFGQLTFEMWRACRLVVDTGMHAMGWTRQQAIDFMVRNTSLAPVDIEAEVDRYIAWPGQALAYKIGELRILGIRKRAEQRLGSAFNLRQFHDALLSGGAMPIDILEKRMDAWIEAGGTFR